MVKIFTYENTIFGSTSIAYELQRPSEKNMAEASDQQAKPGLVFLSGFKSDLTGTKAQAVADWATTHDYTNLRFDYFGHGQSSGDFEAGTLSGWREEVSTILTSLTDGPQILIGSSFGGFLASLAAIDMPSKIAGLVLIAPAFDMTERLMRAAMSDAQKQELRRNGKFTHGTEYDSDGYPITQALLEDGRQHCILDRPIPIHQPVHILHGQKDDAVPWALSSEFSDMCESENIQLQFFKNGDHRLSSPLQIEALLKAISLMIADPTDPD